MGIFRVGTMVVSIFRTKTMVVGIFRDTTMVFKAGTIVTDIF